ncbi:hypothetical protein BYT27DRAFT_7216783 [Phlegmacium glaucopus]|nr:hypothetical protein BYT27DRAFT_7216783 [Phlegmacium glaucopus]
MPSFQVEQGPTQSNHWTNIQPRYHAAYQPIPPEKCSSYSELAPNLSFMNNQARPPLVCQETIQTQDHHIPKRLNGPLEEWLGISLIISIGLILQLRIYVLYDKSRKVAAFMVISFVAQIAIGCSIIGPGAKPGPYSFVNSVIAELVGNISHCKVVYTVYPQVCIFILGDFDWGIKHLNTTSDLPLVSRSDYVMPSFKILYTIPLYHFSICVVYIYNL